jgi:hypothetical protein
MRLTTIWTHRPTRLRLTHSARFEESGQTMRKGLILLFLTIVVLAALGADLLLHRGFRANAPVPDMTGKYGIPNPSPRATKTRTRRGQERP